MDGAAARSTDFSNLISRGPAGKTVRLDQVRWPVPRDERRAIKTRGGQAAHREIKERLSLAPRNFAWPIGRRESAPKARLARCCARPGPSDDPSLSVLPPRPARKNLPRSGRLFGR